jgi:GNAT superfamily N-acetyltransferase
MSDTGYEISHYRPEHEVQVLEVLKELWTQGYEARAKLFRWKYLENPHAEGPLGIVALRNGRVVGFRGYFADRFVLDGCDDHIGILHPGDTCVDPDHRNKGLSIAMGRLAMQYDTGKYRLFMNMTCSRNSLPGYLQLGFQSLAKRVRLMQHGRNPLRWLSYHWLRRPAAQIARPLTESRIEFGRSGNILVTDSPLPAEMASIIEAQVHSKAALRLHQDRAFFEWRYRNPVQKYVFYFLLDGNVVRGYVAIGVSASNLGGEILDYGGRDDHALRELFSHIDRSRHFLALSVFSYGVDEKVKKVLGDLHFSAIHSLQTFLKRGSIEELAFPILIRPIAESFTERAFMINGVDARKFDSWQLKPICSDAA